MTQLNLTSMKVCTVPQLMFRSFVVIFFLHLCSPGLIGSSGRNLFPKESSRQSWLPPPRHAAGPAYPVYPARPRPVRPVTHAPAPPPLPLPLPAVCLPPFGSDPFYPCQQPFFPFPNECFNHQTMEMFPPHHTPRNFIPNQFDPFESGFYSVSEWMQRKVDSSLIVVISIDIFLGFNLKCEDQ